MFPGAESALQFLPCSRVWREGQPGSGPDHALEICGEQRRRRMQRNGLLRHGELDAAPRERRGVAAIRHCFRRWLMRGEEKSQRPGIQGTPGFRTGRKCPVLFCDDEYGSEPAAICFR